MNQKQFLAAPKQTNTADEPVNIRRILTNYRNNWLLFAATMVVAFAVAIFYVKYSAPAYDVTATLMIKDNDQQPNQQKSSLVEFQALEQVNAPKVVENEIEVLRSNKLLKDVVTNFQLWADYKLKGGIIKDQDLYGKSPVKLNLIKNTAGMRPRKFSIRIADTASFTLQIDKGSAEKHRFGDIIEDKDCTWTVTKNSGLGDYIGDEVQVTATDPEAVILGYQNRLKIESQEKPATIINISLSDANVKKAQDFINYLIFYYKQSDIEEKSKITKSTLDFIDNRLGMLSGQLNQAENNIEGYRSANGLTDIGAQSQMYLQGIQANGDKLNEINTQLAVIDKLDNDISANGSSDKSIPQTAGIADQHLSTLVQKLSELKLERNKLLATLPERNPAFEPIDRQITLLKQEIKDNIATIKSSLGSMQKSVQSYKSSYLSAIKTVPVKEHQLNGMGRQQSTKSSLYEYLLQQREAISLSFASSASEVRLVDAAHILPVKASKKYIPFAAAFLFGLVFPAGLLYGKDLVRNTVNNRKVIEQITGVPVIAEFSNIKLPSPIVFENKSNPESFPLIEQFRHLRTQINTLNAGMHGVVILVTSSVANEGKSMVSINLSVSLANTGKRVLLVETDIYKPKVSEAFGLPRKQGISAYLNGKAALNDVLQHPSAYPDLTIMGSGAFIDDFAELLERKQFADMIAILKADYDYIIFDTPPVHAINDANIIGSYSDMTLYVVRFNHTSGSLLPFIGKLNSNEELPNMNIIFNGLENGRDGEGYKYENYYRSAKV